MRLEAECNLVYPVPVVGVEPRVALLVRVRVRVRVRVSPNPNPGWPRA